MAGEYNFTIEQGATFNLLMTWRIDNVPVNLAGYTARLQARIDVDETDTILSLTTGAGITLGGAAGTITLDQTATQTAVLPKGEYVYDLELQTSAGTVTRLLQGELNISAEVTR
jgi:Na+/serine symporter